ncbi:hypothetical protein QYF36_024412 [Acer negundo]|nr:hypothetical protein QYF36_024412 [Acer negundo]
MRLSSTKQDPVTFLSLIRQCIDTKSISDIKKVQTQIMKSGFLLGFGDKLIDGYLKCGGVVDARKLFDELPKRHIVTWNSMISAHIGHKRTKEAIGLYKKMILEGVFPDEYTFSSIFKGFSEMGSLREGQRAHGFSIILGLEASNVFVGSALVDMYSKFGQMRDAKLVADRVVKRDVVLFTALIVGYSQHGEDREALAVFVSMINGGVKANEYTFASILIACGNVENLGNGKLIHGLIIKSGFESVVASQTSLLTMYSKCGLIDDSLKVFKRFANPNLVTWTSLIVGLVQNGKEEVALTKFRQMTRNSINPNAFTLSSVLRACSSIAMLEEGKQIHAIVTKHGLDRDTYCGAALVDLYGKCGSTEMARLVFDDIIELDVVSMNSMMYSYAQNGLGHEALEMFNRMKDLGLQPNDATFVSVLIACSNAGETEKQLPICVSKKGS